MPRQTVIRYLGWKHENAPKHREMQINEIVKTEERHAPGKFGQLSEDGLHVKDLAGDEEADSDGGKVDNPRGHLRKGYLHFKNEP